MRIFFDFLQAIVLGLVQGITEWLPISAKAHLLLLQSSWPLHPESFYVFFKVILQIGSIAAVLYVFCQTLNPWSKTKRRAERLNTWRLWGNVLCGSLPGCAGWFLCRSLIETYLNAYFVFAITLIAYGIIFVLISFHEPKVTIERLDGIDSKTALSIGLFQCLALVPGTSRSGASILGGMYLGCSRAVASRFSFLIAVPVMVLAGLADGFAYFHNGNTLSFLQGILLTLGVVVTFVVSVVTIKWFLRWIQNHTFQGFGWYRIFLGIAILMVFYL